MKPVLPPAMLGVLGGGQLGRFFARAAKRLGYRVAVLDPDRLAPAHREADLRLVARYDDPAALARLARDCAAVTLELESVPVATLHTLAQHCLVAPAADALAIAQDRLRAKRFLRAVGLPTAPFVEVLAATDATPAALYPAILKTARNGYDGKGQIRVARPPMLASAWRALGEQPCVLEKRIAWKRELSVILARGCDGTMAIYSPVENRHRNGILELSRAPAEVPAPVAARAVAAASLIAESLEYVGVLAVEFFLDANELIVNEFAARPHNSGHYTLDACTTSQFEQQVRALCGLPLGSTALRSPAAMVNVLGDAWHRGEPRWRRVNAVPGARLHLYGKAEARPARKMGHVTVLASRPADAAQQAERVLAAISNP